MKLVIAILLLQLAGCSVLYSETRDKQAQELRAAYAKIDVKGQIAEARANRVKLLNEQLTTSEMLSAGEVKARIHSIVLASEDTDTVENQLIALGVALEQPEGFGVITGNDIGSRKQSRTKRLEKLAELKRAGIQIETAKTLITKHQLNLEMAGFKSLSCEEMSAAGTEFVALQASLNAKTTGMASAHGKAALAELATQCTAYGNAEKRLEQLVEALPEIKATNDTIKTEQQRITALRVDSKARVDKLKSEATALAKAKEDKADKHKVAILRANAEKALADLKTSGNVFDSLFLSEGKVASFDTLLTSLKDYDPVKGPHGSMGGGALGVMLTAEIADQISASKDFNEVAWGPMVMMRNLHAAQAQGAAREIETRELRILLLREKRDHQLEQIKQFTEVDNLLVNMDDKLLTSKMAHVLGTEKLPASLAYQPSKVQRVAVHQALAYYIDAGSRVRTNISASQIRLNALEGEIRLSYAETNLNQWVALLDANVAGIEAAGKVGLKVEQINTALNNVFLLWIGKGVN